MPTIFIDNQPYEVSADNNLLHQCLSLGFNLPYFCWHPALGSVGACRQCAVSQYKNKDDNHGRIVMACMTEIKDGMHISITDNQSTAFRARIIEWMMSNHPHDCPVCDEGGECHLQDMTVMSGHTYRQYRFPKRTFTNQDLGPFINHEMNRCITCYRCVRFYSDYAGGKDLQAFASKNHVYFGRHKDGALENEFSGNLVEVCPTGVFTDKTLKKHYTRKWDLQSAPSVCIHCAVGCNIFAGERYGNLRRILNRYHPQVNGYFICDRGRFGYEFVNSEQRPRQISLHGTDGQRVLSLAETRRWLSGSRGHRLFGIGSPRASLEANFALRSLVGTDNYYAGLSEADFNLLTGIVDILQHGYAPTPTLREIENSDAVFILGEDISNTAPRVALASRRAIWQSAYGHAEKLQIPLWMDTVVRDAAGEFCGKLWQATTNTTRLDDIANNIQLSPADIARLGFAVANSIDPKAPPVKNLKSELRQYAKRVAQALKNAARPLIITGSGCMDINIVNAAANIAKALSVNKNTRLYYTLPECNQLGLALLNPKPLSAAFQTIKETRKPITAIILENDLYRRATRSEVDDFLAKAKRLVSIDYVNEYPDYDGPTYRTTEKNTRILLPAATYAEDTGTMISSEGRMQRFFATMPQNHGIKASWQWCAEIFSAINPGEFPLWRSVEDVMRQCAEQEPLLNAITCAAPLSEYRIKGLKVPRSPHRYSGRTAMHANIDVFEPRAPQDPNTPLAFSMEGYPLQAPAALTPFYWAAGWNSIQSCNKYQREVGDSLRGGDPGVRMFAPDHSLVDYFSKIPAPFRRKTENQWLLVPMYFIFGSEELSANSPAIAQRAPQPFIAINEQDALTADIENGEEVKVLINSEVYLLPCRVEPVLPSSVAGLPAGLKELNGIQLPAWATIMAQAAHIGRRKSG